MESLISIIVPVYNAEKTLNRCVDSIINQTYTNLEIILVDDGSTDNSLLMCKKYQNQDKRVKVLQKSNGGVSSTRNLGLREAVGKYICFVDSDDFIDFNFVKKLFDKIKEDNSDLVFCRYKNFIDKNNCYENFESRLESFAKNPSIDYFYLGKNQLHGSVCRVMFSKEILVNQFFNEKISYCEDLYFITKLLFKKPKVSMVADYLYYYCENKQSVTKNIHIGFANKCYKGVEQCCLLLRKNMFQKHALVFEFASYILACKECCFNREVKIQTLQSYKFRTRQHYRAYLKNCGLMKAKFKAFLSWHKLYSILKFFYK